MTTPRKHSDRWLLPSGVEEVLPQDAARQETLRRQLLDCYQTWAYELVAPPMVEFLDSLNIGAGTDLALQTFTITDQLSGRLMGVRADITPQVARIDAHTLDKQGVVRLCYSGTVLHSVPASFSESRALDQIGVELFGSSSIEADIEVMALMLGSVKIAGGLETTLGSFKLDLGHVGIFRGIANLADLSENQEQKLCDILQRKALPELKVFIESSIEDKFIASLLESLLKLCGGKEVFAQAQTLFSQINDQAIKTQVLQALTDLENVSAALGEQFPEVEPYYDLGELRGYNYHTGLVFAVYKENYAEPIAKGGRYDHIGESFGRSRPATGFSADLKTLSSFVSASKQVKSIAAPKLQDDDKNQQSLVNKIAELRSQGESVAQDLDVDLEHLDESCDRRLVLKTGEWVIESL